MKVQVSLFLLAIAFSIMSCSKAVEETNPAANTGTVQISEPESPTPVSTQSSEVAESTPPSNPRDRVVFDGKNYIKKSGWNTPSRNDTYIDGSYDQGDVMYSTESGKLVRTNTIHYIYRNPWAFSQEFYFDGRELDYLEGRLESLGFLEMSGNGKVFMYSITVGPLILNDLDHRDPFGYRIQDRDGDGIFESLLSDDADIVVPNWVLK